MEWIYSVLPETLSGYLMPLIIFFARISDVSIGTIRIVFLTQGRKRLATFLGMLEVSIWLLAVSSVIQNVHEPLNSIAYVGGYAAGNYIGMTIVERLALGNIIIRLVTKKDATALINHLYQQNYKLTVVEASGREGQVLILFMVIKRRDLNITIETINQYNPNAFFSVEDVRQVQEGAASLIGDPLLRK